MPELPEVETIRAQLDPLIRGRQIVDATSHPSAKFAPAIEAKGAGIEAVRRRGKYLLIDLDDDRELIIHLGMTGVLSVPNEPDDSPYVRASWALDDGRWLSFSDVRRFGRIRVVDAGDYGSITTLSQLGPEPSDPAFTAEHLYTEIRKSSRRIKTQLLSQKPVAGLGNIYADEALWLAKVRPQARKLSKPAAARLRDACVSVIADAITNGGTTLRDYRNATGGTGTNQFALRCYGRSGEPCERCGDLLRSASVDARTTTWCPTCQSR
jgi:formamidopyrimidine-DNA glycosylase